MKSQIATFLGQYRSKTILVDTNLALLWIVGTYDKNFIQQHKRTKGFGPEDFDLLTDILLLFNERMTTPHLLTEISNFLSQVGDPSKGNLLKSFWNIANTFTEHQEFLKNFNASTVIELGVADASIENLVEKEVLVLSQDFRLVNYLLAKGLPAINFNHLRSFA